ncbi:MAG: roadblock/LC7 domain-containing protein, partial [Candidatus Hodarchaeota archaeon]
MSEKITEEIQTQMADILRTMEETSELSRCVVVTRAGIKVAPDMDADTYSASSAALIDLGERVVTSLEHGSLQELVINALGGYVILVAVGKQHMLLGATAAALKMGYYLPFLRKKAWELENTMYGDSAAEFAVFDAGEVEDEASNGAAEGVDTGVIDVEELKQADMAAMDDVLAAFDEFGIDDEFSASLTTEAAPAVGISEDEMASIREVLQTEQEEIPDFSTTSAPSVEQAPVVEEIVEVAGDAGECPIPLEPGEV